MMDVISVYGLEGSQYVLVAESKKSPTGEAKRQCMLAMNDMWDHNNSGEVYGFVTTGEWWRMIKYDGTTFFYFFYFLKTHYVHERSHTGTYSTPPVIRTDSGSGQLIVPPHR